MAVATNMAGGPDVAAGLLLVDLLLVDQPLAKACSLPYGKPLGCSHGGVLQVQNVIWPYLLEIMRGIRLSSR